MVRLDPMSHNGLYLYCGCRREGHSTLATASKKPEVLLQSPFDGISKHVMRRLEERQMVVEMTLHFCQYLLEILTLLRFSAI